MKINEKFNINNNEIENGIIFKNFIKKFKKNKVGPLDFSIEKGKVTAILGSSGAGKTVVLNTLTGATRKFSGLVSINGVNRKSFSNHIVNKSIGYYTQMDFSLIDISAYEYLKNIAIVFGIQKKDVEFVVSYWMKYFDLWSKKGSKLQDFSQGMKNRMNIIIAVIKNPEILILDEPGANLDSYWRNKLKNILLQKKQSGGTIILTVHNIDEIVDIVDHYIIIDRGSVIFKGSAEELDLFKKYKITFKVEFNFEHFRDYLIEKGLKVFKYNKEENSFVLAVHNDKLINHIFLYCLKNALPISRLERLAINMESIHKALEGRI